MDILRLIALFALLRGLAYAAMIVVYCVCCVSGDCAQWEEDNLGVRRS